MSRIGKKPITVPAGVTVSVSADGVTVKGPKGELSVDSVQYISASLDGDTLSFSRANESRTARANHGLMRALVNNCVLGVTEGFKKQLSVQGVGYRADVKGKTLVLNLGYSHLVEYPIPSDVEISVDRSNNITITGIDKGRVGQVAAVIRDFRRPDRYKGKGVRYVGEYIALKAGKSA